MYSLSICNAIFNHIIIIAMHRLFQRTRLHLTFLLQNTSTSHSRQRGNFLYNHQWCVVSSGYHPLHKRLVATPNQMHVYTVYIRIIELINEIFHRWNSLSTISQLRSHDYCQRFLTEACPSHNGRTQRQASAHQ